MGTDVNPRDRAGCCLRRDYAVGLFYRYDIKNVYHGH